MAACSARRIAVILGFFVIFTIGVVRAHNTSQPTDLVCDDHENPFWINSCRPLPGKHLGEWNYRLLLSLQRIPQQYVGCDKNHNDQLKEKFYIVLTSALQDQHSGEAVDETTQRPLHNYYIINDICHEFMTHYYFDQIKKAVERNLLTVLRAQVLSFFNTIPDSRLYFQLENRLITKLSKEELLKTSDQIKEYFRTGYKLPADFGRSPYLPYHDEHWRETFNATLNEIIETHVVVTNIRLSLPYLPIEINEIMVDDARIKLYDHYFGKKSEFVEILTKLGEGIRVVRKYAFDRPEKVELKFPMIHPCFG